MPKRPEHEVTREMVVERAVAQRGRGRYKLGGGAIYTAASVDAPEGNRFPGYVDCTGLVAYSAMYQRVWENARSIVADALSPDGSFDLVPHDAPVLPGDLIVNKVHAGVIVGVLPGFVRGGPEWWRGLRVVQAAGDSWQRKGPQEERADDHGAVRETNAYRWRRDGYIVRPRHVTD